MDIGKKNLLTILIPALICIVVFLLPASVQEAFALNITQLNWYSWFTYIFVHAGTLHLLGNLGIYLASCSLAYAIFPERDKNNLYKIILLALVIVPLITLVLTLFLREVGLFPVTLINSRGFSGVGASVLGILGVSLARHLENLWTNKRNNKILLHLCYFFFIPSIAVMSFSISWMITLGVMILWILLVPFILYLMKEDKIVMKRRTVLIRKNLPIVFGVSVLLLGSLLMMPKILVQNGSIVNTFAHLIGFIIGFALAFFMVKE